MIIRRPINGDLPEIWVAGASIAVLYSAAVYLPEAFGMVFLSITAYWAVASPFAGFLVLFPSIVPLAMVEMPGMTGISPVLIFTGVILVSLLLRPRQVARLAAKIPPYALIGALVLLAAETVSAILSPAPTAGISIAVRLTRTLQFLLAAALAGQPNGMRISGRGWMLFGLINVLAAAHFWMSDASVLVVRGNVEIALNSVDGIAAMVVSIGYVAVGSAWYWFAASNRRGAAMRTAYLIAGGLCLASAFYSGRRQAILAVFFAMALATLTVRKAREIVRGAVAGLIVLVLLLYGPMGELLAERGTPLGEFSGEKSTGYLPIHEAGLKAFLESPLLGIGLGNYISATQAEGVFGAGNDWASAHSSIVRILAETGITGGVPLAVLLGGFLYALGHAVLHLKETNRDGSMRMALPAFGVILTGITVTLLDSQEYNFLFGQAIGLLYWGQQAESGGRIRAS